MPFYPDAETFYTIMNDLFSQVMARPDLLKPLRDGKVVMRITTTQPDAILVVDGRAVPPRFTAGMAPDGKVDVGLRLPADVLHNVWLGKTAPARCLPGGQNAVGLQPVEGAEPDDEPAGHVSICRGAVSRCPEETGFDVRVRAGMPTPARTDYYGNPAT